MKKILRYTFLSYTLILIFSMNSYAATSLSSSLTRVTVYPCLVPYNGKPVTAQAIIVEYNDDRLVEGVDYTVTKRTIEGTTIGMKEIILDGKGEFFGKKYGSIMLYKPGLTSFNPQISDPTPLSCNQVGFQLKGTRENSLAYYGLFRSTSPNGPFELYDVMHDGNVKHSYMGGGWYIIGVYGHSVWTIHGDQDDRNYSVVVETELDKTYYYKVLEVGANVGSHGTSDDANSNFSNTLSIRAELSKPFITTCYSAVSGKSVKLNWRKVNAASGYEIYRKQGKGSWKKVKNISKNKASYTDKKVSSGKTYQYRIRAYKTQNGKKVYGAFSSDYKVTTKKAKVKGNYKAGTVYGPSMSAKRRRELKQAVQGFKTNYIRSGMSEVDKAFAVYAFVRDTCSYGRKSGYDSAWGAIVNRNATCVGYARAVKALCDAIGLKCYYVKANSRSFNPYHTWNIVRVDKKWYILDSQGGMFLVGQDFYIGAMGLTWNEKLYPTVSITVHPEGQLDGRDDD